MLIILPKVFLKSIKTNIKTFLFAIFKTIQIHSCMKHKLHPLNSLKLKRSFPQFFTSVLYLIANLCCFKIYAIKNKWYDWISSINFIIHAIYQGIWKRKFRTFLNKKHIPFDARTRGSKQHIHVSWYFLFTSFWTQDSFRTIINSFSEFWN